MPIIADIQDQVRKALSDTPWIQVRFMEDCILLEDCGFKFTTPYRSLDGKVEVVMASVVHEFEKRRTHGPGSPTHQAGERISDWADRNGFVTVGNPAGVTYLNDALKALDDPDVTGIAEKPRPRIY